MFIFKEFINKWADIFQMLTKLIETSLTSKIRERLIILCRNFQRKYFGCLKAGYRFNCKRTILLYNVGKCKHYLKFSE